MKEAELYILLRQSLDEALMHSKKLKGTKGRIIAQYLENATKDIKHPHCSACESFCGNEWCPFNVKEESDD